MKKTFSILSIFLIIILLPVFVSAAPFLVCDPQDGVTKYEIFIDGQSVAIDVPAEVDGSLKYDLGSVDPGKYTFTAKACAEPWGCSELSDPYQSPNPAQKPIGLKARK